MKTPAFFVFALLLVVIPHKAMSVSSGDLLGQILDIDTHQPVPYAVVVFENYYDKVTVTANEHGLYYGFHIPEGRYQMRVTYNNRTFVMNRVKVYDSYSNEVNFFVSCNDTLPTVVNEVTPDPIIKPFVPNDILLTDNGGDKSSKQFSDILLSMPAVDIYNGKIYVKGMEVSIFIDGSPVLAHSTVLK
jgi:hypothetical protein